MAWMVLIEHRVAIAMQRKLDRALVRVGALRALDVEDASQPAARMDVRQPVAAFHQLAVPGVQRIAGREPVDEVAFFIEPFRAVPRDVVLYQDP